MPTTLDLIREAAGLVASLDAPEGADPAEFDPALAAWLDASGDKLGALHAVTRRIAAEDAEMKAIADRVSARRRYLARQGEHVAAMATALLVARADLGEEPRERRPEFTAWLATTVSTRVDVDPGALAPQYRREKLVVEADRAAIKAALEAGEAVDGCALVTSQGVRCGSVTATGRRRCSRGPWRTWAMHSCARR